MRVVPRWSRALAVVAVVASCREPLESKSEQRQQPRFEYAAAGGQTCFYQSAEGPGIQRGYDLPSVDALCGRIGTEGFANQGDAEISESDTLKRWIAGMDLMVLVEQRYRGTNSDGSGPVSLRMVQRQQISAVGQILSGSYAPHFDPGDHWIVIGAYQLDCGSNPASNPADCWTTGGDRHGEAFLCIGNPSYEPDAQLVCELGGIPADKYNLEGTGGGTVPFLPTAVFAIPTLQLVGSQMCGTFSGASSLNANFAVATMASYVWQKDGAAAGSGSSVTLCFTTSGQHTVSLEVTDANGRKDKAQKRLTVTMPAPVASVTLSPTSASILKGSTATFTATLKDASGNVLSGRSVSWSTTNASVIGVQSTTGTTNTVTGLAAGSAVLQATSEGVTGSATVTVTSPPSPLAIRVTGPTSTNSFDENCHWVGIASGGTKPYTITWAKDGTALASSYYTMTSDSTSVVSAFRRTTAFTLRATVVDATGTSASQSMSVSVSSTAPACPM